MGYIASLFGTPVPSKQDDRSHVPFGTVSAYHKETLCDYTMCLPGTYYDELCHKVLFLTYAAGSAE